MTKEKTSSSISMGVIGILRESFKIPLRNRNISVSLSLALFLIIPSCSLFLCNNLLLKPPLKDLITKSVTLNSTDVGSPETLKLQSGIIDDVGIIILVQAIYLLATSIVSLAAGVAAIYAWAAAYSQKELALGDLYRTVGRRWKRPLITWLYITLFKTGYLVLLAVPVGIFAFMAKGSVPLLGLGLVIVIMGLLFFQYLIVIWKLSFVISVVDEEVYGLDALRKAGEIIKGRRLQGFGLYFLLSLGAILITRVSVLQMTNIAHAEATRLAMGVMDIVLVSLYWLYVDAVSTVFYYECKKSHGEEVELQGSLGYSMLPTTAYVDGDVL